jgi:hypothetical protein
MKNGFLTDLKQKTTQNVTSLVFQYVGGTVHVGKVWYQLVDFLLSYKHSDVAKNYVCIFRVAKMTGIILVMTVTWTPVGI